MSVYVCVCVTFLLVWMEILICFVGALHWWTKLMTHNTIEFTMIFIYWNIFFLILSLRSFGSSATHTQFTSHISFTCTRTHCVSGVTDFRFWRLKSIFICNLQQNEKHFFLFFWPCYWLYILIHATTQTVCSSVLHYSFTRFVWVWVCACMYPFVWVNV